MSMSFSSSSYTSFLGSETKLLLPDSWEKYVSRLHGSLDALFLVVRLVLINWFWFNSTASLFKNPPFVLFTHCTCCGNSTTFLADCKYIFVIVNKTLKSWYIKWLCNNVLTGNLVLMRTVKVSHHLPCWHRPAKSGCHGLLYRFQKSWQPRFQVDTPVVIGCRSSEFLRAVLRPSLCCKLQKCVNTACRHFRHEKICGYLFQTIPIRYSCFL